MRYLTYHETFPCYHSGQIRKQKIPGHFLISEIFSDRFICFCFFFGFKIQRQDPVTFGSLRRVRDRTCSGCVLDEDKTLLFIQSSVPVLQCCVSTSVRTWVTLPQSLLQCKQIFTACLPLPIPCFEQCKFSITFTTYFVFYRLIEWLEETMSLVPQVIF